MPGLAILAYVVSAAIVGIGLFDLVIAWGLWAMAYAIALISCWAFLNENRGYESFEELTGIPVSGLNPHARKLVPRYWAFYTQPFLAIQLAAGTVAIAFAAVALAIIGAFKQFWWGLGVAALVWIVSAVISSRVNPTFSFRDPDLKDTHEAVKKLIAEALLRHLNQMR